MNSLDAFTLARYLILIITVNTICVVVWQLIPKPWRHRRVKGRHG
jgi:hypothetical protein